MKSIWRGLALAAVSGLLVGPAAAAAQAQGAAGELTVLPLMIAADRHVNRTVTVVIVEPLRGPSTEEARARSEYGQVYVDLPESGPVQLSLVPAAFTLSDPNRYKHKFDRVLAAPIKVRGEFLFDPEMKPRRHYVIRVTSLEPLTPPTPVTVRSLAEIDADPAKWNRRRIVYEGTYETRFEVSTIDSRIWLRLATGVSILNKPKTMMGAHKVRVTGYLFSYPGAHYGHMASYPYELVADSVEFYP